MDRDLEHLRLLSIFHYVLAGLCLVFSLLPLIYLGLGVAMLAGFMPAAGKGGDAPDAQLVGWIVAAVGVGLLLLALAFSTCLTLAGRFLSARRHYTFCMIIAALSCFWMPFGTVLGVFTLVVLTRESVKTLFQDSRAPAAGGP